MELSRRERLPEDCERCLKKFLSIMIENGHVNIVMCCCGSVCCVRCCMECNDCKKVKCIMCYESFSSSCGSCIKEAIEKVEYYCDE